MEKGILLKISGVLLIIVSIFTLFGLGFANISDDLLTMQYVYVVFFFISCVGTMILTFYMGREYFESEHKYVLLLTLCLLLGATFCFNIQIRFTPDDIHYFLKYSSYFFLGVCSLLTLYCGAFNLDAKLNWLSYKIKRPNSKLTLNKDSIEEVKNNTKEEASKENKTIKSEITEVNAESKKKINDIINNNNLSDSKKYDELLKLRNNKEISVDEYYGAVHDIMNLK